LTCCFWVSTTSWTADCLAGLVTTIICRQGPAHLLRPVTIKSLHERGLLDANFGDSRVHRGELVGAQNLDGARHEHSPEVPKFQVWTRALVRQALKQKGLLVDDDQLLYH
jgi:hypothetical protein